jgi:hypothetical protein
MTLDEIIKTYGEPDDAVICDPTHGNEAEGMVLIYSSAAEPFIIYEDTKLPIKDIIDVTVKNVAIAYLPNDYSLLVSTTDEKRQNLSIHTGTDAMWAEDVCKQLINALSL